MKKNKKNKHFAPSYPNALRKNHNNQSIAVKTVQTSFAGPIPPPEILIRYDEVIPQGADRILKMAESQSEHRQYLEKWAIISGAILSYVGVFCALCITITAICKGANLVLKGYPVGGTVFAGVGVSGLVYAFIYGTHSRREERQRRESLNKSLINKNSQQPS